MRDLIGLLFAMAISLNIYTQSLSYTYSSVGGNVEFRLSGAILYSSHIRIWNYGDGTVDSTYSKFYNYSNPGNYYACLTVIDSIGNTNQFCDSITITCYSSFGGAFIIGNNASFGGRGYGVNSNETFNWTFGDGNSGSGRFQNNIYNSPGKYNVCMTAIDSNSGCNTMTCDSIEIFDTTGCTASFTYSTTNNNVAFSSITNNPSGQKCFWDFGDGSSSVGKNVNHKFGSVGSYNVCLTIMDSISKCTKTFCDSVKISSMPLPINLYGYVTLQGDTSQFSELVAYLIKEDTNVGAGYIVLVDSMENRASYYFKGLTPNVDYYVKVALPSSHSLYSSYLPTYSPGKLLWSNASSFNISSVNGSVQRDITIIKGNNPGGPGFIGGYVSQGANLLPGDPYSGLDVVLKNSNNEGVSHVKSDKDGKYEFKGLAYGTYNLYVDKLNIPAEPILVKIDEDNPERNINLEVNRTGVVPVETSVEEVIGEDIFSVFPNPTSGRFEVKFGKEKSGVLSVFNVQGDKVYSQTFSNTRGFSISLTGNLNQGLYFVQISSNEEAYRERIVIKK